MTSFIGQITVILEAGDATAAERRLRRLASHLDDTSPEIVFADHNGDVENYDEIEAQCEESLNPPCNRVIPFDGYEIHGVRRYGRGKSSYCEQVPDSKAQFWSLYGHIPGQGVDCIGDFKTREDAEEVYERITRTKVANRRMTGADSALRHALSECIRLLSDYEDADGEEGDAYRQGLAALGLSDQTIKPTGE
jgi:hypothetical protein